MDGVIARAESEKEVELRSDLARYSCIRLAGYLEQSLLSCGQAVSSRLAHAQARRFAESHLGKSFNPKQGAIADFVGRFDQSWRDEVEMLLAESERGGTINALVGIRNQLAHGASQGVSIERVEEYRIVVEELVEFALARFDP